MENKQTAVDWLMENLHTAKDAFTQAKAIEKQQIEDAYDKGSLNHHAQYTKEYDNLKQDYIKTYTNENR